ncbi:MAG: ABC transporter ATP-binding protein, partial [Spirochaetaceae bacterium]
MVTLDSVSRTYEDGFSISVSLSVDKGSLVSLLGPSGSGKTTTLRFIAGFEEPDSGRIVIEGHDVTHVPPADRRVGFVFQDYTLFPHMNVFDNVAYGLRVRHTPADDVADRVNHFLSVVGLPGYGGRDVHTLSGGERQRVALARALVIEPDVLLLDEPFSSIDAILRRDLRREVMRLQRSLNVTTIFVTHSRDEAMSIADHLVLIKDGAVIQQDPPDQVYSAPVNRFAATFVGGANFIEGTLDDETLH